MAEVNEIALLKQQLEAEKKKNEALETAAAASKKRIAELEKGSKVEVSPNCIQYHVTMKCYWNDILWHEDDIVDIPENLTPPEDYFEKVK